MGANPDRPDQSDSRVGGVGASLPGLAVPVADVADSESGGGVFDGMSVMLVGLVGPDHHCLAANAAYRALGGWSEVVGEPLHRIVPDGAPGDLVELADLVFRSGVTQRVPEWRIHSANDETGTPSESYLDLTLSARHTSDGRIAGVDLVAFDITDRVHERRVAEGVSHEAQRPSGAAEDVVVELQRALLPVGLPVLPGMRLAARYLVAPAHDAAGGDWFDAVPLSDGWVALVVGDVVGHGVAASAAMGQLRAVVNEALASEADLSAVVARVDAFARRVSTMRAATLAIVEVDPVSGQVRYALCGHPPPLIASSDGTTRVLAVLGGLPLGLGAARVVGTDTLGPGETVVLYSDGLIERPGRTPHESLAELVFVTGRAAADGTSPLGGAGRAADRVATSAVEQFTRAGYHDDVTVLTAERLAEPVPPFHASGSSQQSVTDLRRRFTSWLDELEPSDDDRYALELAISEALANAVQHAYPSGQAGPITVHAELDASGLVICQVNDSGRWRPPVNGNAGGRGLWLAQQLVDRVRVKRGEADGGVEQSEGTAVTVCQSLRHSAGFGVPATMEPMSSRSEFRAKMTEDGSERSLQLSGHLDITTAADARRQLLATTRGGVVGATLDLTEVTLLGSAGVKVLFDVTSSLADHDQVLAIVAPRSTVAAQVLDLVGLLRAEGAQLAGANEASRD